MVSLKNIISVNRLASLIRAGLFLLIALVVGSTVGVSMVHADDPFVPDSDDTVLVVLPKSLLVERDMLQRLRSQLTADPDNPKLAATVSQRYLSIGKRGGDPRFYGYARAAVAPWWEDDSAPAEILKVRAKLKENDHQFENAVTDLKLALKQKPKDPQLLLELANVFRVQGKFTDALSIGDRLEKVAGPVPAALGRAPLYVMTGRAKDARSLLKQILPAARADYPSTLGWISTVQADVALALGESDTVEQHFREGLGVNPADVQLLHRYGDFLLDQNRNEEALELLQDHVADNGVLLRAAIAAKRCQDIRADDWSRQLERRFEEIRLRGSEPHGRFESRFALQVQENADRALQLATKNWKRQKELRDAQNFLEAAIAAGDFDAGNPVLDFLQEHNTQHALLDPLVEKLRPTQ
ncbi:tetratricopeptide repeat protein [Mariniblastus fucicola]|uniref:Uncharacterized protein n=1 Tax=Mariniblastus fucicola TaxID=980251 RepID=A0A5B9PE50_9BACT|nr:tetratricopeptide repeat protein [Mariniblastus fucicola]QEG23420.1 hypothetical protein MFFC18_33190 [Mariniblastus fucicola]